MYISTQHVPKKNNSKSVFDITGSTLIKSFLFSSFEDISKFLVKFGALNSEKANSAKSQRINKEILANATNK